MSVTYEPAKWSDFGVDPPARSPESVLRAKMDIPEDVREYDRAQSMSETDRQMVLSELSRKNLSATARVSLEEQYRSAFGQEPPVGSRGSQIAKELKTAKASKVTFEPATWDDFFPKKEKVESPPKEPGLMETAGKGLAHGTLGLAESIGTGLQFIGNRVGSQGVADLGESMSDLYGGMAKPFEPPADIQGAIAENPGLLLKGRWWLYNLAETAPSLAASIIPGVGAAKGIEAGLKAIKVAGTAIPLTEKVIERLVIAGGRLTIAGERLAIAGGALVGGAAGGSLEGAQTYREVLKRGGSEPEAAVAGSMMALASAALNAASVGRMMAKAPALKRFVLGGGTEALTEWGEEPAEGAILGATSVARPEDDPATRAIQGLNVLPIAGVLGGGASVAAGRAPSAATPPASTPAPAAPGVAPAPPTAPIAALPPGQQPVKIVFPDGSVINSQQELDQHIASLPPEQQVAERARLLAMGAQPATPEPMEPLESSVKPGAAAGAIQDEQMVLGAMEKLAEEEIGQLTIKLQEARAKGLRTPMALAMERALEKRIADLGAEVPAVAAPVAVQAEPVPDSPFAVEPEPEVIRPPKVRATVQPAPVAPVIPETGAQPAQGVQEQLKPAGAPAQAAQQATEPAPAVPAPIEAPQAAPLSRGAQIAAEIKANKRTTKEPWQMTRKELADLEHVARQVVATAPQGSVLSLNNVARADRANQDLRNHRAEIAQRVKDGKPVPAEVLADYPDLTATKPPVENRGKQIAAEQKAPSKRELQRKAVDTRYGILHLSDGRFSVSEGTERNPFKSSVAIVATNEEAEALRDKLETARVATVTGRPKPARSQAPKEEPNRGKKIAEEAKKPSRAAREAAERAAKEAAAQAEHDKMNAITERQSKELEEMERKGELPKMARASEGQKAGITSAQLRKSLAEAFGDQPAQRLLDTGIIVPVKTQAEIPEHVVPYLREGDRVFGFYDPKTDRTYAVLENLSTEQVRGLALHEIGIHYGFKRMLGDQKYDQVLLRLEAMRASGNQAAKDAYEQARKEAVTRDQVPEEALAYLVTNQPQMGIVKTIIAQIKAFLFREFGIGAKSMTDADMAMLAKAAVIKAGMHGKRPGELRALFHKAWHGSPHDFDQFKLQKIGTGEGAQAYGWGMYFAGKREVAEYYRNVLTGGARAELNMLTATKDGRKVSGWNLLPEYFKPGRVVKAYAGLDEVISFNGDPLGLWDVTVKSVKDQFGRPASSFEARPRTHGTSPSSKEVIDELSKDGWTFEKPGKLYQVELAPQEDEYLYFDKPLSEQSEKVTETLAAQYKTEGKVVSHDTALGGIIAKAVMDNVTAEQLYAEISREVADGKNWREGKEAASKYLLSIGIPGIKYLEGASRAKGEGNYNYVIFDDSLVKVEAKFSRNLAQAQATHYRQAERDKMNAITERQTKELEEMQRRGEILKQEVGTRAPSDVEFSKFTKLSDAVKHVASKGNEFYKALAQRIGPSIAGASFTVVENGVTVPGGVPLALNGAQGVQFTSKSKGMDGVWVRGASFSEQGINDDTVMHEALHQATARKIQLGNMKASEGSDLQKAVADLYDLANHVIREYKKSKTHPKELEAVAAHAFNDPREMISYGFTDQNVQAFLKETPGLHKKTAWSEFVDYIRRLFGIAKDHTSALADLIEITDRIVGAEVPASAKAVEQSLTEKGLAQAIPGNIAQAQATHYRQAARTIVDRIDGLFNPLGTLPEQNKYLIQRGLSQGLSEKANDAAKEMGAVIGKASQADNDAMIGYWTTAGAKPDQIADPSIRAEAVMVKQRIGQIADDLVAAGMISQESRDEYRDAYLPRLYLKHLLSDSEWKALGSGKIPSDMGYTLKRNKNLTEDYRKIILGEITDAKFLAGMALTKPVRDMALLDWLNTISLNENWVMPGTAVEFTSTVNGRQMRVTPFWLQSEAARLKKQMKHQTQEVAAKAEAEAKAMEQAADDAIEEHRDIFGADGKLEGTVQDFKQIPNTARFGRLRGLVVRKEIYDDLMGAQDFLPSDPGWFQNVFGYGGIGTKATQIWKATKVAMNPPSQVRNFVSNGIATQLFGGVPLHRLPSQIIQTWRDILGKGKYYEIARKHGVGVSTFATQEVYRMKTDLLNLELRTRKMGSLGRLHQLGKLAMGHTFNKAGDWYQFSETLFKTVVIRDAMENRGMSEEAAVLLAQEALVDYSLVTKSVRYARNAPIGIPFLVYQMKVLPRLVDTMLHHPERFLPWVALFYGFPMMVASMLDVDDDDLDKLKKAMPEWLQDKGHAMVLPNKDDQGRFQVFDAGYMVPWGMWTEAAREIGKGELGKAFQTGGIFGGPITDIVVALKTGKDPFTKRDIWQKGDPPMKQLAAITNYIWNVGAPPILTDRGLLSPMGLADKAYGGKLAQAITGTTNKWGEPRSTATQAVMAAFGMNVYAITPEYTRAQNVQLMTREMQDVRTRMRQQLQDRSLNAAQRKAVAVEYAQEIVRRTNKLKQYLLDSAINPRLATAR